MSPSELRIEISAGPQRLRLFRGPRLIRQWPCSTSLRGLGETEGSFCTPTGRFAIAEKFGDGEAVGTIFKARKPVGHCDLQASLRPQADEDWVLTRILWLRGLQAHNANTRERYIYIHGTNHEYAIGKPASHGCIRLASAPLLELYDLMPLGAEVWIGP